MSNYPLDGISNEGEKVTDCLSEEYPFYIHRATMIIAKDSQGLSKVLRLIIHTGHLQTYFYSL